MSSKTMTAEAPSALDPSPLPVVEYLARRPSPLAAYWFGPRNAAFRTFTSRIRFGGTTVNDIALHAGIPLLPFGGVGHSGSGAGQPGRDRGRFRRI